MILQGLFNILDLYSNEIDLFYNNIDKYFRDLIQKKFGSLSLEKEKQGFIKNLEEIISFLKKELLELGFEREEIEIKLTDQTLEIRGREIPNINSVLELYEKKIAPLVYEIFLEKIVDYLVDINAAKILMTLKSKGFFPIEFIARIMNFKKLLCNNPEKKEKLHKYIQIREKVILKLKENKNKIESLEDLEDPKDKLQLIYLIYKIIDFFHLQKIFDFSHIESYLKTKIDEWLDTIPLITLKNPDLYFCGIYLADKLNIKIDKKKIREFLLNLYEENVDEFESPIIEATDRIYYYLKSTSKIKLRLSDEKIKELIKIEPRFFESQFLKNLETSQLVVILKLYSFLGVNQKMDLEKLNLIIEEIEKRITREGIKQYRDGFISSEATYYVLFCNYMRNTLDSLRDHEFLESIISRIYRNLEILDFSSDMNHDLVSELFYSCESLKLFNCIETKQMIIHLAKHLFPQEIVNEIINSELIARSITRFRHLKVNKITGETIY